MKPNHAIESNEDLLKHFGSSKTLEILDLQQMEDLLKKNVPPKIWEDASNRNLLSFNQEFVQQTKKFRFGCRMIEHIYPISFLVNLTELDLYNNNISDISVIFKLKNLNKLDLRDNCIEDISLQSLPDLTHLYLSNNNLTSYTLALPNLVELQLSYNKLQDKSGLQHSPKLEILNLNKTETSDLRSIPSQLFGLKELYLSSNSITEISYLSNFIDLKELYLSQNKQLQTIRPLKFCTQLTYLIISATNVSDIWPLKFLKNLKSLQIAKTQVVDLHPLQYLNKLETIYAPYSGIIDVSPLSKLTQLNSLDLRFNKITNADTLKHHKKFSEYNFSDQEVPTPNELTFYSKILYVHSSHKQIRKIQNDKSVPKFRASLASKKNYISAMLNNQIMMMSQELNLLAQFIQNSNSFLD
ncbi:leucine-rich_repeat domain-containing protein [Hexamita inflata]|uniref:Leucine-rich repeat domain-containing protein n=1 Tax=Hexamita inflata TaxID=28002 RepID=A0AA86TLX4_9EUKA|nr:leucine-rich repeat domain-containing protein [Hexamita inflata]